MKIKSLIAGVCLGALAFGSFVYADDVVLISETNEKSIYIDDTKIDASYLENDDKSIMIPVRKVCEFMGFNVEWNSETNDVVVEKSPMYFTFNIYRDGYTLSKTAPILLGNAPVVENNTTYVPLSFVSDIMSCEVTSEDGIVNIKTSETEKKKAHTVIFNGVTDNMCVVYDIELGDVLVNISNNTVVSDDVNTLEKGQILEIVYDDFMTMSLPPITNALQLTKVEGETAEVLYGTVSETITEDGVNQIIIKDESGNETALNVSADKTLLMDIDGTKIDVTDFELNKKVTAVASMASTRSIPPQRAAFAVRIAE